MLHVFISAAAKRVIVFFLIFNHIFRKKDILPGAFFRMLVLICLRAKYFWTCGTVLLMSKLAAFFLSNFQPGTVLVMLVNTTAGINLLLISANASTNKWFCCFESIFDSFSLEQIGVKQGRKLPCNFVRNFQISLHTYSNWHTCIYKHFPDIFWVAGVHEH